MKKVISFLLIATLLLGTFIMPSSALEHSYLVVIGDNVNIRKGPGTQYASVRKVTYGEQLFVYEIRGNWVRIWDDDQWISADYVVNYQTAVINPRRKVKISSGTLTVRQGPTTAAPATASLANNTVVTVEADTMTKVNGYTWAYVVYGNNQRGWVCASYLVNA